MREKEFFAFLRAEMRQVIERWREHRRTMFTEPDGDTPGSKRA